MPGFYDPRQHPDLVGHPVIANQRYASLANNGVVYLPLFLVPALPSDYSNKRYYWVDAIDYYLSASGTPTSCTIALVTDAGEDVTLGAASSITVGQTLLANTTVAENTVTRVNVVPTAIDGNQMSPGTVLFARLTNGSGGALNFDLTVQAWIRSRPM